MQQRLAAVAWIGSLVLLLSRVWGCAYNITTLRHESGLLATQQFVDQIGAPALESAQGFLVITEITATDFRVSLWFAFRGPWDQLTSDQLAHVRLWLLVSNGTHRHAPLLEMLPDSSSLPAYVGGNDGVTRIDFSVTNISIPMYAQNEYFFYPHVPVPRNYNPLHGTETRVFWAQATPIPQAWVRVPVSIVRDTADLLAIGANSWQPLSSELASAFGGVPASDAPALALEAHFGCVDPYVLPPQSTAPMPQHQLQPPSRTPSSLQTSAAIIIGVIVGLGCISALFGLAVWKRIRAGHDESRFTRWFDNIARFTGYDPSGYADIDPPDVRARKEREMLTNTLNAHRNNYVVVNKNNASSGQRILLDNDSDSLESYDDDDILSST